MKWYYAAHSASPTKKRVDPLRVGVHVGARPYFLGQGVARRGFTR